GLMGDSVDNIPGVKGIGEKGASKLIQEWGSVENIYENIEQLKGATKEKLAAGRQSALDSKKLATTLLDAPVPFEPDKLGLEPPDAERLGALFGELEFRALGKRVLGDQFEVNAPGPSRSAGGSVQGDLFSSGASAGSDDPTPESGRNIHNTPHQYHCADTADKREALLQKLLASKAFAF